MDASDEKHRAFIGLGANLGDAHASLRAALASLRDLPGTELKAVSSIFRSAPVDAVGPDFLNAVVELSSSLPPDELLRQMQAIELVHGRQRPFRHAPRTLDLDLLLYGDLQCDTDELQVPHPRMHQRAFVLLPLVELAPDVKIPGLGPAQDYLSQASDQRVDRIGPLQHAVR